MLGDYATSGTCGDDSDGFNFVKFTCCKSTQPPTQPPPTQPPGESCENEEQGGDTSCKPAATWKQYAGEACEQKGLHMTAYTPVDKCGDDSYQLVKYTCCKSTTPPPPTTPPPGQSCENEEQGGDTSCKPAGTWKQYAGEACEQKGLHLTAYTPVDACGDDSYRLVKYTCCK